MFEDVYMNPTPQLQSSNAMLELLSRWKGPADEEQGEFPL